MNEEQLQVVHAPLGDMRVIGNPGSGKTTTMLHRIRHVTAQQGWPRHGSAMMVTFSREAAGDVRRRARELSMEFGRAPYFGVRTLHSLAGSIFTALRVRAADGSQIPNDLSVVTLRTLRLVQNMDGHELRRRVEPLRHLKLLIVDEAQDLSSLQFHLCRELADKLKLASLVLCGDPFQNIYLFRGGSDKWLRGFDHGHTFALVRNHRARPHLVRFANHLRPNSNTFPRMAVARETKETDARVTVHHVACLQDALVSLLHALQQWRQTHCSGTVAVIGPLRNQKERVDRFSLKSVENQLAKAGIPFSIHYGDSDDDDSDPHHRTHGTSPSPDVVQVHTIHSSKGKEFDHVFVINFHQDTQGYPATTLEERQSYANFWWVATTRAREAMSIFVLQHIDPWPALQQVPQDAYHTVGPALQFSNVPIDLDDDNVKRKMTTSVMQFLREMTEEQADRLYRMLLPNEITRRSFPIAAVPFPHGLPKTLLGQIVEAVFEFRYQLIHNDVQTFLDRWRTATDNYICVANFRDWQTLQHLLEARELSKVTRQQWQDICAHDDTPSVARRYLSHMVPSHPSDGDPWFVFLPPSEVTFRDDRLRHELLLGVREMHQWSWALFQLVLYDYQLSQERRYLWETREQYQTWATETLEALAMDMDRFILESMPRGLRFQCVRSHPRIALMGVADAVSVGVEGEKEVIELKYCGGDFSLKHLTQVALYSILRPGTDNYPTCRIINFCTGQDWSFTVNASMGDILHWFATMGKMSVSNALLFPRHCGSTLCRECEACSPLFPDFLSKMVQLPTEFFPLLDRATLFTHTDDHEARRPSQNRCSSLQCFVDVTPDERWRLALFEHVVQHKSHARTRWAPPKSSPASIVDGQDARVHEEGPHARYENGTDACRNRLTR